MGKQRTSHQVVFTLVALAALLAITSFAIVPIGYPKTVRANGAVVDFQTRTAGPYEVSLGTSPPSPSPGNLHITMFVRESATGQLVLDAVVTVAGMAPEVTGKGIGPVEAEHLSGDPQFYDVNTSVDQEGTWKFVVDVSGPAGEGTAEFDIQVIEPNPVVAILSVIFAVLLVIIIAMTTRMYMNKRRQTIARSQS
ncbi:MAG: FixH family protein [Chloroflexi bacterium]|nr:FixH family protein [Chloroflexota bacterium]